MRNKKAKPKDFDGAMGAIRAGAVESLAKVSDEDWSPLWVHRDDDGGVRIERLYGGDAVLQIPPRSVPIEALPLINALLDMLAEQAWYARMAAPLVRERTTTKSRQRTPKTNPPQQTKADAIRAEIARLSTAGKDLYAPGAVLRIATKTGASEQYVRSLAKSKINMKPQ